jgi:hypothetical protein
MGNIGIIGRARVGKDTAGAWLVDNRGYRRVAFADPLKEAALTLDPIVDDGNVGYRFSAMRLSEAVGGYGWEAAKDQLPEVRRVLQELGASIRAIDPEFWLRAALKRVTEANEAGVPAVITDVRYPNEAESLRRAGFHLLYIHRPGVPHLDHESEGALTDEDADHLIINNGSLADLQRETWLFADRVERLESRRHFARL